MREIRGPGLRVLVGALAAIGSVLVGVTAIGAFDPTPDPNGIPAGANGFMLVLAIALLIGFAAYAAVELAQTRRLDSISRQFGTRTIVLMTLAIPINIVLGQVVGTALRLPIYLDSMGTILVGVLAGPLAGVATGLLSNLTWTFILGGTPLGSPFAWPFAIVAAEIGLLAGLFGYAGVFRGRSNTALPTLLAGIGVGVAFAAAVAVWGILPFYRNLCAAGGGDGSGPAVCFPVFAAGEFGMALQIAAVGVLALLGFTVVSILVRVARSRDLGVIVTLVAGAVCGLVSAFIAAPIAALVFGGVTGSGTDLLVALFQQAGADLQTAVLQQAIVSDTIDKAISFVVVYTLLTSVSRRVTARFPQGERALGTSER